MDENDQAITIEVADGKKDTERCQVLLEENGVRLWRIELDEIEFCVIYVVTNRGRVKGRWLSWRTAFAQYEIWVMRNK